MKPKTKKSGDLYLNSESLPSASLSIVENDGDCILRQITLQTTDCDLSNAMKELKNLLKLAQEYQRNNLKVKKNGSC